MLLFVIRALILLATVSVACASNLVAGTGRLTSDPNEHQDVQFSVNLYSLSIESVAASTQEGPNRTTSVASPASKLYGVNVSTCGHHFLWQLGGDLHHIDWKLALI